MTQAFQAFLLFALSFIFHFSLIKGFINHQILSTTNRPKFQERISAFRSHDALQLSKREEISEKNSIDGGLVEETKLCSVVNMEKYPRLPVWPVWSGVLYFVLDRIGLRNVSCFLEDLFGGRVCPMMLDSSKTDPFILMVHHRHSFSFGDPLRYISRLLLPEGFPAHPHRGFETVTYVLKGSMTHRDSIGVKQTYGSGSVQWLTAGRGILHEEMWHIPNKFGIQQIELYQIWVNLPSNKKMDSPKIQLFGKDGDNEIPEVYQDGVKVRVIAGETLGAKSQVQTATDLAIYHASIDVGVEWFHRLGEGHGTCFVYNQQGAAAIVEPDGKSTPFPTHHTAFLGGEGNAVKIVNTGNRPVEVLLLSGVPIAEPIVAQGTMVMNTDEQIQIAYNDYYAGKFGPVWDQNMPDDEWLQLINEYKSKIAAAKEYDLPK